MIALYITLWLLSGFLAAWVGHKYLHKGHYHTSLGEVAFLTLCGGITLIVTVSLLISNMDIGHIIIFKAKEKK